MKETVRKHRNSCEKRKNRISDGRGKLRDCCIQTMNSDWDFEPPKKEYFDELFRVSRNQIIWGGNYFDLPPTRCIVCWDKEQPWENFSQFELAWTSFDYPAAIFRERSACGKPKIHPTQKPVSLYAFLMKKYAKPGDRIFDSHLGSGSSRIAAFKLGYDFYATEIDEKFFRSQEKRFRSECFGETVLANGQKTVQKNLFE